MKRLLKPSIAGVARFFRKYRAGLVISGVTCVVSVGLYFAIYLVPHPNAALRFLADIELRTLDTRFQLRGPRPPEVVRPTRAPPVRRW